MDYLIVFAFSVGFYGLVVCLCKAAAKPTPKPPKESLWQD